MRLIRLTVAAVVATLVGAFALAAPAAAHVTVSPSEAVQGSFARLAFRVPNESDAASTTKVEVFLPENAPVASVSTMPVAGWTVAVQRRKLDQPVEAHGAQITEVVSQITWTAASAAAGVQPGQFQEFPVSLGPLPDVEQMVFKALQTYSDGNLVRWIEEAAPGVEAEHPAPVLKLVPAAEEPGDGAAPGPAGENEDEDSSGAGLWLGLAGLVAGLAGVAIGLLAYRRAAAR